MDKIRIGVVGLGNMGRTLTAAMAQETEAEFRLAAVCDYRPGRAQVLGREHGVAAFEKAPAMFASGLIDAVYIATPHYWHAPLAVRAAQHGLHVLCEKPLAVTAGAARAMVEACRQHRVALGCMFMMRTRGLMKATHDRIAAGDLGPIHRIAMTCSTWFRTQHYYDSGEWRGTWDGEGGGVLMNQAPHHLDLFQWFGGLPRAVTAAVATRAHRIEVEDTVNVFCDYGDGRTGTIYTTTAEAPGLEQFMVAGDRATLLFANGALRLGRLRTPLSEYLATAQDMYGGPACDWEEVQCTLPRDGQHLNVVHAWAAHILHGTPMVCSGEEALNEVELCNAIYLAGFTGKTVHLPVDAAAVDRLLARLERERSRGRGGNLRRQAARELAGLLRRN